MKTLRLFASFILLISGAFSHFHVFDTSFSMILGFLGSVSLLILYLGKSIRAKWMYILLALMLISLVFLFSIWYTNKIIPLELFKALVTLVVNTLILLVVYLADIDQEEMSIIFSFHEKIILLSAILSIFQFVFGNFFNVFLFAPWQRYSFTFLGSAGVRGCGIFSEPGHFGLFASLYVFTKKDNQNLMKAVIITIGLLTTFSLVAYFSILMLLLSSQKKVKITIIAIFLIFTVIFISTPYYQRVLRSLTALRVFEYTEGVTTFQRIWLGFFLYKDFLSTSEKLFGIGIGDKSVIYERVGSLPEFFMNGFSEELSGLGFVGFLFLNIFLLGILGVTRFLFLSLLRVGDTVTIFSPWCIYIYFVLALTAKMRRVES